MQNVPLRFGKGAKESSAGIGCIVWFCVLCFVFVRFVLVWFRCWSGLGARLFPSINLRIIFPNYMICSFHEFRPYLIIFFPFLSFQVLPSKQRGTSKLKRVVDKHIHVYINRLSIYAHLLLYYSQFIYIYTCCGQTFLLKITTTTTGKVDLFFNYK